MVQTPPVASHISALTGRSRRTKRFGNQATLAQFPDSIIQPDSGDPIVNPRLVNHMKAEFWGKIMVTLDRWSEREGGRDEGEAVKLAAPLVSIVLDDKRIYLDLIAEIVPADVGLRWYVESFNIARFRSNLEQAIDMACSWFATKQWNRIVVVNEQSVSEAKSKP